MKRPAVFATCVIVVTLCASAVPASTEGPVQNRRDYAQSLVKQGKIDEAIEQYRLYYAENPQEYGVLERIATLCFRNGRSEDVITFTEEFLTTPAQNLFGSPRDYLRTRCVSLLQRWNELGDADAAKRHYAAMAGDADAPSRKTVLAHLMLATIDEQAANHITAKAHYQTAIGLISPPQDEWQKGIHRGLLVKFIDEKLLDDAVSAYRIWPHYDQLGYLGEQLKWAGRGFEMQELYEACLFAQNVKLTPEMTSRRAYSGFGGMLIERLVEVGQGEALREKFRAKIAEQPDDTNLYRKFGYLLYRMNRYADALAQFNRYFAVKVPPFATEYAWAGDLFREAGLIDDAVSLYKKALDTEITEEEVSQRTRMYRMRVSNAQGRATIRATILNSLGELHMQKERWEDAEMCFEQIMGLDARDYKERTQTKLAEVWREMGQENMFVEDTRANVEFAKATFDMA